ncbi:MAG TPA: ATP-dependent nuclease subunit B [Clostridiales bacterium]|nr:ATP-dependent nuclease subunit B [Clostridiales bacterium]
MLKLILGRAGSGKTARIMEEIKQGVDSRRPGLILLVPEQYSHEAERELCRVCGDAMSLYAEVLSFTRLASRVEAEVGGGAKLLDKGGRMLCMALSVDAAASRLRLYGQARRSPELQESLLNAVDELKSSCVNSEALLAASEKAFGSLGDKLWDLSLILGSYDAILARSGVDPSDRLTRLAENIHHSSIGEGSRIYIDGFTDFTAQEMLVIRAFLRSGAELTVCLNCESLEEGSEVFEISRRSALALLRLAKECGSESEIEYMPDRGSDKSSGLVFLEENLFSYTSERFDDKESNIELYLADGIVAECELAAAKALELVRERDCRWRDISIAVRGFEEYRPVLESVFERYGVPLYMSRKSDILQKPLPALILSAFEIITGGWNYDAVFSYLKTGLVGISPEDCDLLENYVLLWSIRGNAWTKPEDWALNPQGYGGEETEETARILKKINALRRQVAGPLARLQERGRAARTAREQVMALSGFFDEIDLQGNLRRRAGELKEKGRLALAAEYVQLWDIVVNALEQCAEILGDAQLEQESFARFWALMLSSYDVGTIPISLDRVSAGDMDRMRRRHIKHLIILGASDQRLPRIAEDSGIFSADEREELMQLGLDLGGTGEEKLLREFCLIYNCLSLPSETLIMTCPAYDTEGDESRPSFVMNRIALLFGKPLLAPDREMIKTSAPAPAFELAVMEGNTPRSAAARKYFLSDPECKARLEDLKEAAKAARGRLSPAAVKLLYGEKLRLSASRVDAFSSCRFAYFLQYGLRLKPRKPAGFNPPEMGSFMHYVLEGVSGEALKQGGFGSLDERRLRELTDKYVEKYVHEELNDFRERSARFIYLFRRLSKTVRQVVSDMAQELKASNFVPLDFELDFSGGDGKLPPVIIGEGEEQLAITGIADRVDGWISDGKLYIRVVDYKTGKKNFSLSDVWYGMGLQMLMYLFTLERLGPKLYGHEIIPAGVLYVPARDVLVTASGNISDEDIIREKAKSLRRSGLVLDNPEVIAAMEKGEEFRFLPVKFNKNGEIVGGSLASLEQLGKLSRFIDRTLREMAGELRRGSIAADPYFRGQQENACLWCDYIDACHFDEARDKRRYLSKLKPPEAWSRIEKVTNTDKEMT